MITLLKEQKAAGSAAPEIEEIVEIEDFPKEADPVIPQFNEGLFKDYCYIIEWALDIRLTNQVRELIHDEMMNSKNDGDDMMTLEQISNIAREMRKAQRERKKNPYQQVKQQIQQEFIKNNRGSDKPASIAILQLYDSVHRTPVASPNKSKAPDLGEVLINIGVNILSSYLQNIEKNMGTNRLLDSQVEKTPPKVKNSDEDLINNAYNEDKIEQLRKEIREAEQEGDSQKASKLYLKLQKELDMRQKRIELASNIIYARTGNMGNFRV